MNLRDNQLVAAVLNCPTSNKMTYLASVTAFSTKDAPDSWRFSFKCRNRPGVDQSSFDHSSDPYDSITVRGAVSDWRVGAREVATAECRIQYPNSTAGEVSFNRSSNTLAGTCEDTGKAAVSFGIELVEKFKDLLPCRENQALTIAPNTNQVKNEDFAIFFTCGGQSGGSPTQEPPVKQDCDPSTNVACGSERPLE